MTRQQRLTIVAAVIGNGLEWYNFMLYGVFAAVIAHLYFPTKSGLTSLLLSLGTFGVGFFMRPVGGVLLGIYSDKVGRKQALAMTIMLMCIGTLLIAVTPTYATIGLAAPLLLVLARLLQGFSTGGEMGNATAYMRDYAPPERRAHFFSWVYASSGLFIGLGLAVGTIFSAIFSHDALYAWGCMVRGWWTRIPDPPASQQTSQVEGRPLQHVLTHHLKESFATGALFVTSTICTYVLAVYTPVYTVHTLKLPQIDGFFATMLGTLIIGCLTPVVGHYVDRYGPKLFLRVSAALLIILAWPMFTYANTSPSFGGPGLPDCVRRGGGRLPGCHPDRNRSDVPVTHPGHRPFSRRQHRCRRLWRFGRLHHHVADRDYRQPHGARGVSDDRRGRRALGNDGDPRRGGPRHARRDGGRLVMRPLDQASLPTYFSNKPQGSSPILPRHVA